MPEPRFSVIIVTYNRPKVLQACLSALLPQLAASGDCEVIVGDDGGRVSYGFLPEVQLRFPGLLRLLRLPHRGPACARNACIREAKGEIVVFLDDDSLPLPGWFDGLRKAWVRFPSAAGIGGGVASGPAKTLFAKTDGFLFNWYLQEASFLPEQSVFLSTCNASYRREELLRIGLFSESFPKACGEDRDLNARLRAAGGHLVLCKEINVVHSSLETFGQFVRRHIAYGQAARTMRTHRFRSEQHMSLSYRAFFRLLVTSEEPLAVRVGVGLLFLLAQLLTCIGYCVGLRLREVPS